MKNRLLKWLTGYMPHPISDNKDVVADFRKFNSMLNHELIEHVEKLSPIPQTGLELVLKERLKDQIEYNLGMERDLIHTDVALFKANERIDEMHKVDSDSLQLQKTLQESRSWAKLARLMLNRIAGSEVINRDPTGCTGESFNDNLILNVNALIVREINSLLHKCPIDDIIEISKTTEISNVKNCTSQQKNARP